MEGAAIHPPDKIPTRAHTTSQVRQKPGKGLRKGGRCRGIAGKAHLVEDPDNDDIDDADIIHVVEALVETANHIHIWLDIRPRRHSMCRCFRPVHSNCPGQKQGRLNAARLVRLA